MFKDWSAAKRVDASPSKSLIIASSAASIAASKLSSPTTLKDASAVMLFCNEVSATIERDSSASTSASLLATSEDKFAASDSSPATLADASADTAIVLSLISVDNLVSTDSSPEIRLETSRDVSVEMFVSIDVIADCKPSISATTIPTGAVICALSKIKSDCLFNTILVVDIKKLFFFVYYMCSLHR